MRSQPGNERSHFGIWSAVAFEYLNFFESSLSFSVFFFRDWKVDLLSWWTEMELNQEVLLICQGLCSWLIGSSNMYMMWIHESHVFKRRLETISVILAVVSRQAWKIQDSKIIFQAFLATSSVALLTATIIHWKFILSLIGCVSCFSVNHFSIPASKIIASYCSLGLRALTSFFVFPYQSINADNWDISLNHLQSILAPNQMFSSVKRHTFLPPSLA